MVYACSWVSGPVFGIGLLSIGVFSWCPKPLQEDAIRKLNVLLQSSSVKFFHDLSVILQKNIALKGAKFKKKLQLQIYTRNVSSPFLTHTIRQ